MTTIRAPKFDVALGEEDGNLFAAVLWPEDLGICPFRHQVSLDFVNKGFLLSGENASSKYYFDGVSDDLAIEIAKRFVVVVERNGDDFNQYEVMKSNKPAFGNS